MSKIKYKFNDILVIIQDGCFKYILPNTIDGLKFKLFKDNNKTLLKKLKEESLINK